MNAIYPAAAGAGGFAFRHHAPQPMWWSICSLPEPDSWARSLFLDYRADIERKIVDALRIDWDGPPTPAGIKDRLVAFVERYIADRTVIDVRRDPDDPTKLIVERRIALPPQLETIP